MGLPPPPPQPGYRIPQPGAAGAQQGSVPQTTDAQFGAAQQQQQQQQQQVPQQQQQQQGGMPQNTDAQFGATGGSFGGAGADRGALLVSLPVQVLDNGKLRVEQVELYANDDAEDFSRVFCINHRIGDPECAKLLEALKQRRTAAVGQQQPGQRL